MIQKIKFSFRCALICFRVSGVLIPTRCFGDFLLKSEIEKPAWKQVISAVPQIVSFKITSNWDFIVVGSDGVWDAMTNQEMISFVKTRLSAMVRKLARFDPGYVYFLKREKSYLMEHVLTIFNWKRNGQSKNKEYWRLTATFPLNYIKEAHELL